MSSDSGADGRDTAMEKAVISAWHRVGGSELAVFRIHRPDGAPFFEFRAGQYVRLASPDWRASSDQPPPRDYSISSPPQTRDHLEFYVTLVRELDKQDNERLGSFTARLFAMQVGDELQYGPPEGRFTLDRTAQQDVFLVASGTGLAPFMSMVRGACVPTAGPGGDARRFTLLHGVRYGKDLGYREELETIAAQANSGLVYAPTVSRAHEDPNWSEDLGRGRVNDLIRRLLGRPPTGELEPHFPAGVDEEELSRRLSPQRAAIYLCGNPEMITDCTLALAESGFACEGATKQVLTEDYW